MHVCGKPNQIAPVCSNVLNFDNEMGTAVGCQERQYFDNLTISSPPPLTVLLNSAFLLSQHPWAIDNCCFPYRSSIVDSAHRQRSHLLLLRRSSDVYLFKCGCAASKRNIILFKSNLLIYIVVNCSSVHFIVEELT